MNVEASYECALDENRGFKNRVSSVDQDDDVGVAPDVDRILGHQMLEVCHQEKAISEIAAAARIGSEQCFGVNKMEEGLGQDEAEGDAMPSEACQRLRRWTLLRASRYCRRGRFQPMLFTRSWKSGDRQWCQSISH